MKSEKIRKGVLAVCLMATTMGNHCSGLDHRDDEEGGAHRASRPTSAVLRATARAWGETELSATLYSGLSAVRLGEGETLTATVSPPEASAPMERRLEVDPHSWLFTRYRTVVPGNEAGTLVEVAFDTGEPEGAAASPSRSTLPSPFRLDWVASPSSREPAPLDFSRSQSEGRYVIWDSFDATAFEPGDHLRFAVTGDCIEPLRGRIDWERGEDSLELTNTLRDRETGPGGATCVIEVELSLRRLGEVGGALGSGSFVAEQVRTIRLLARP